MQVNIEKVIKYSELLFHQEGYKNTNVNTISKAANVATGSIYNFFSSKRDIIFYVALKNLGYDMNQIAFPVSDLSEELISKQYMEVVEAFYNRIDHRKTGKHLDFESLLSTLFDFTYEYNIGLNLINYNGDVFKKTKVMYDENVKVTYDFFKEYIEYYMENNIMRKVEYPSLHIHNILEGIIFWSLHLPTVNESQTYDKKSLKRTAIDVLTHAYKK